LSATTLQASILRGIGTRALPVPTTRLFSGRIWRSRPRLAALRRPAQRFAAGDIDVLTRPVVRITKPIATCS
jgi:hypothetical protein